MTLARLKSYEGRYRSASPKPFRFTIVDQERESDQFPPARFWYAPQTAIRFVIFDWVESKEYRRDFRTAADGSVRGFVLHGFGSDQLGLANRAAVPKSFAVCRS